MQRHSFRNQQPLSNVSNHSQNTFLSCARFSKLQKVTKHFVSRFSISEWRCKRYVGDVTRVAVGSLVASLHITRVLVIDPYAADYVQLPADVDVGPEFGATLVHVDASKTDKFTFRTRDVTTT